MTGPVGTVLRTCPGLALQAGDRASLATRRGCASYLASICSEADLNPILPQVLLGNEHVFPKSLVKGIQAELGGNVERGAGGTTMCS